MLVNAILRLYMMRLFVLDNIDSFTYNLVHLCYQVASALELDIVIEVKRADECKMSDIEQFRPHWILLSPGPGHPRDAQLCLMILEKYAGILPIFGVCLGMQVMATWKGLPVNKTLPVHGKKYAVSPLNTAHLLFTNMPERFEVVRYHSLHVPKQAIEEVPDIKVLATCNDKNQTVMAMEVKISEPNRNKTFIWGVQFHPESIGTSYGQQLMTNVFQAVLAAKALVTSGT